MIILIDLGITIMIIDWLMDNDNDYIDKLMNNDYDYNWLVV